MDADLDAMLTAEDPFEELFGGDEIDLDGELAADVPDEDAPEDHFRNLVNEIDEKELQKLSQDLVQAVEEDIQDRKHFDDLATEGMEQLGIDRDETRNDPFPGASAVRHPLLAQAVVEYQARIMGELFRNGKAVRAIGPDPVRAKVVETYTNDSIMLGAGGYYESMDQAQIRVALEGTIIRKVRQDVAGPIAETIPLVDFAIEYSATDLRSARRKTHVLRFAKHQVELNFKTGFWQRIDLDDVGDESNHDRGSALEKADDVTGAASKRSGEDDRHVFYEVHTYAAVEGDDEAPYVIHIHVASGKVVSVRRNWAEDDGAQQAIEHFVAYKFLPWIGIWGIGLYHLIGGMAKASTGALRSLLDSAQINNLPSGLMDKSASIDKSGKLTVVPGQLTPVNVPHTTGERDIRKHFMPLPFKEPSMVLYQLLEFLVGQGKEFASVSVKGLMDADKQAPVGTTTALIEQGSILFSSIHGRQHRAFAIELGMFRRVLHDWMPDEGDGEVTKEDFAGDIRLVPASDPSTFSSVQRVSQAQATVQMVREAKGDGLKVDTRTAYIKMASAIGVDDPDSMFPEEEEPQPPAPMGPQEELAAIFRGQPVKAHPGQNHAAHAAFFEQVMLDPAYVNVLKKAAPALEAAYADHMAQMAIEDIGRATGQMPAQIDPMTWQVAQLAAEAAARIGKARRDGDPQARLLAQETEERLALEHRKVDLKHAETIQKGEVEQAKIDSREKIEADKLDSKEQIELARLRSQRPPVPQVARMIP